MTLFIEEAQMDVHPIFPGVRCESHVYNHLDGHVGRFCTCSRESAIINVLKTCNPPRCFTCNSYKGN